jgi:hypothetical protein
LTDHDAKHAVVDVDLRRQVAVLREHVTDALQAMAETGPVAPAGADAG